MTPLALNPLFSRSIILGVGFAMISLCHAADPATEARLRAMEHEMAQLRLELAKQRSETPQDESYSSKDVIELPKLTDPADLDAVYVTPKQSPVTELNVRGRMHYQFGYSHDTDDVFGDYATHEWRRMRLGVDGKLLDDWSFLIVADILPDSGSTALDSASFQYHGWEGMTLSFEKLRPRFGAELTTSSSKIITVERSNLSNHLDPKKLTGVSLAGEMGFFDWQIGSYNGELGTNTANQVPEWLANASVGIDLSEQIPFDELAFRFDYLYNSDDEMATLSAFEDAYAAHIKFGHGKYRFVGEFMAAEMHGGGDLWGISLMPSYQISEKLEGVLRYEYIEGDGTSVGPLSRYAGRLVPKPAKGDEYWAAYAGLNYYINKSVKLMFGVEYADLDDSASGYELQTLTGYGAVRIEF